MKEKEQNTKKRKSKLFILFMFLYVCIWAAAILLIDEWIWDKAQAYQTRYDTAKAGSQPKVFMDEFIKEVDAKKLVEWLNQDGDYAVSEYTVVDEYEKYFSDIIGEEIIIYEETEIKNTYDVRVGEKTLAQVKIVSNNTYDEFGFSGWEFSDAEVLSYMGQTFSKTIVADKNYDVYVNDMKLTEEYIVKEKTTVMGEYMSGITGGIYGTNVYKIEGFLVEPDIYAIDKNGVKQENTSVEIDMAEYIDRSENVMDDATRSRVSETFYVYFEHMNKLKKYEDMKKYLVSGTDAYDLIASAEKSLEWVTPVKSITIVEEVIDEYVVYSDTYFSCSVYMNVQKDYGYITKNEYFDATVLFKKVGDQWYWDTFILNE